MDLTHSGPVPWSVAGARLLRPHGEALPLLPLGPVASIAPQQAGGELAQAAQLPPGPFTLTLWDEEGKRTVTLGNLSFP